MRKNIHEIISTVGGLGYLLYAPGTAASAAGVVVCFLLKDLPVLYMSVFLALFAVGVISSDVTEKIKNMKDPSCVVIDEFACIFAVFFMLPMNFLTIITGFILYRLFDILKPPPVKVFEKMPGGWGIMLDDLAAGIMANIFLRIILLF